MTPLENTSGYISLVAAIRSDCEKGDGNFHPEGCIEKCPGSHCSHKYCDQFKWVMNRAEHYSQSLDIPVTEILDSWEKGRNYWYMNYYQNCNQPLLAGENVRVFETVDEFKDSLLEKGFRCPYCGGVSSHPSICNSGKEVHGKICDWKAFGLFGTLGQGTFVYVKSVSEGHTIFTPIAWGVHS
jgi:hypothetical protein